MKTLQTGGKKTHRLLILHLYLAKMSFRNDAGRVSAENGEKVLLQRLHLEKDRRTRSRHNDCAGEELGNHRKGKQSPGRWNPAKRLPLSGISEIRFEIWRKLQHPPRWSKTRVAGTLKAVTFKTRGREGGLRSPSAGWSVARVLS